MGALRFGRLQDVLLAAARRFPLPLLFCLGLSAVAVAEILGVGLNSAQGVFVVFFPAIVWGVAVQLHAEAKGLSSRRKWLAMLAGFPVVCAYWYAPEAAGFSLRFLFPGLLLLLPLSPYIRRASDDDSLWYFNYQNGVAVFFASVSALALGLGASAILGSLDYLFGVDIPGKAYGVFWVLCWALFWPVYIMAHIPRRFDYPREECGLPRGVSFVAHHIFMPLVAVYMLILYAYCAKIALQMELPKGGLAYMVSGFGIFGTVVWILTWPARGDGRLLPLFHRHFHKALLPPVVLLLVGIGVRVSDYGMTEDRYAVLLCGLWLALSAAITVFARTQSLKRLPLLLAAMGIAAALGPWGAVGVSASSQIARLERAFEEAGLLKEGLLSKAQDELPFEQRKNISSIMDYLASTGKLGRVATWFAPHVDVKTAEEYGKDDERCYLSRWCGQEKSRTYLSGIGIAHVPEWVREEEAQKETVCFRAADSQDAFFSVSGWDLAARITLYSATLTQASDWGDITLSIDPKENSFSTALADGRKMVFDLGGIAARHRRNEPCYSMKAGELPPVFLRGTDGGRLEGELRVTSLQGQDDQWSLQGILLLREVR